MHLKIALFLLLLIQVVFLIQHQLEYANTSFKKTPFYNLYYTIKKVLKQCDCDDDFVNEIKKASDKTLILYDEETKLFEQHDGYYKLPHVDINKIPTSEFPLYSHWSYDRIYRNDMIKQPDVLMFMFLYSQDFTYLQKKANYEFYEPRCIHESSLSPSIHSIFACELNKKDEASKFFEFATRMDLDDYNCNTCEGIHTTSIAAAWMNIVYGVGGSPAESPDIPGAMHRNFTDEEWKCLKAFYCPGGFNYEKMSGFSKFMMKMFTTMLANKKDASEAEKNMAQMISHSYDISDKKYIEPILAELK